MAVLQWLVMPFSFKLETCETGQAKEMAQMKKLLVLCTAILLMLSAVGCQQQAEPTPAPTTPAVPEAEPEDMPILLTQPVAAALFVVIPLGYPIADEDLDGFIGPEWADSIFSEIELATDDGQLRFPATLYLKHDGTFQYLGIRVEPDRPLTDIEVFVATDVSGNGGLYDTGDDLVALWVKGSNGKLVSQGIDFAYGANWQFAPDTDFGGTEDAKAAAKFTDGVLSAEFCRPLDSGDRLGNDPRFEPGDEVEIGIGVAAAGSKRFDVTMQLTADAEEWELKELEEYASPRVVRTKKGMIKVTTSFPKWLDYKTETFDPDDFKPDPNVKIGRVGKTKLPEKQPLYKDSRGCQALDLDGDEKIDMVKFDGKWVSVVKEPVKSRIITYVDEDGQPCMAGGVGTVPAGSIVTVRGEESEIKFKARDDGSFSEISFSKWGKVTIIVQHVQGAEMKRVKKEEGGGWKLQMKGAEYKWEIELKKPEKTK